MPKIPGINHLRAVRALEKAGFRIVRQGKTHRHERRFPFHHHTASQSGKRTDNGRDCQRRRNVRRRISQPPIIEQLCWPGSGSGSSGAQLSQVKSRTPRSACFETRSLPTLTRSYPRRFTFYVADPSAPLSVVVTDRRLPRCRGLSRGARLRSHRALAGWIEIFPVSGARGVTNVSRQLPLRTTACAKEKVRRKN